MNTKKSDRARTETEKRLDTLEKGIDALFSHDKTLNSAMTALQKYLARVQKLTEASYKAYTSESDKDIKAEAKKAYMDEIRKHTIDSKEYQKLSQAVVDALAACNQKALDATNAEMPEIYAVNYNQVADECREVGIDVKTDVQNE